MVHIFGGKKGNIFVYRGGVSARGRRHGSFVLRAVLIFTLAGFLVGGAAYAFLFSPWFRIESVKIDGVKALDGEVIKQFVRDELGVKLARIVPRNSYFLLPEETISKNLLAAFPRIASLRIEKLPREITLRIQEREIAGIWCAKFFPIETKERSADSGTCLFIDREGITFERAPSSTSGPLIFLVDDYRSREEQRLGDRVLDVELLGFLLGLRSALSGEGFSPFVYQLQNDLSVYVKFEDSFNKEWWAYFSTQYSALYQARVLARVMNEEIKNNKPFVEYVDLRIRNKVFYKYKE